MATAIDPDHAAPARADLGNVDEWQLERVAAAFDELAAHVDAATPLVLGCLREGAALDHGCFCRGAAHVESDDVGVSCGAGKVSRGRNARRGARLNDVRRTLPGEL